MIRHAIIFWSAILLSVFGFADAILIRGDWSRLSEILIPVLLIAIVYYFYKKGSFRTASRGTQVKVKPSQKTMAKVAGLRKSQPAPAKRKSYPFQVIEGSKGKNDDHLPKYH